MDRFLQLPGLRTSTQMVHRTRRQGHGFLPRSRRQCRCSVFGRLRRPRKVAHPNAGPHAVMAATAKDPHSGPHSGAFLVGDRDPTSSVD